VATNPPIADDKQVSGTSSTTTQRKQTESRVQQKQESQIIEKKNFEKGTISEVFSNYDNYLGREGYIGMARIKFNGM